MPNAPAPLPLPLAAQLLTFYANLARHACMQQFIFLRYAGTYKPDGRQFIVVCGNINYESVQTFLSDFFHPARDDVDVEVLFLNKNDPDLEFEGLLKREHTRVQYFRYVYVVHMYAERERWLSSDPIRPFSRLQAA